MLLLHSTFLTEFRDYLSLGFSHIIDLQGYDHILFIITLCAIYRFEEWKKILILVTAFTLGHSATLALAALDLIRFPQPIIDFLIPLSIFITALHNIRKKKQTSTPRLFDRRQTVNYLIAMSFGLVHGMGFSNYFRFLLGDGNNIVNQLFAFNSGLELGQMLVVLFFMGLLYLFTALLNVQHREWNLVISGAGAGISLILMLNTITGV